jgi:hypothetical protein
VLEPAQVGLGVEAVPRRAALGGHDQADLVVVVQGAHRHAEGIGHLAHGEQLVGHQQFLGHG